jgi:hypothetical protein
MSGHWFFIFEILLGGHDDIKFTNFHPKNPQFIFSTKWNVFINVAWLFMISNESRFYHHLHILVVATLVLGPWPRQWLAKVWAKCEGRESHFMLPGVCESVRKWTPTLPSELPLWELESRIFKEWL